MERAIHVEFERPSNGWIVSRFRVGLDVLEIVGSSVPRDSMGELAGAMCAVLKGVPQAVATWNDEPTEYEFRFTVQGERVRLVVTTYPDHRRTPQGGVQVLAITGDRREIGRAFWRGLRRLQTAITPDDYQGAWGHRFPEEKVWEAASSIK